jgi:hypothetical protein
MRVLRGRWRVFHVMGRGRVLQGRGRVLQGRGRVCLLHR